MPNPVPLSQKHIADYYNQVGIYDPDPAAAARAKVLESISTTGNANPPDVGSPNGQLSAQTPFNSPPAQNVPQSAMATGSAPEGRAGAGTMDEMAAQRAQMLQLNNAASQQAPQPDLSGYQPYPRQFPQIQQRVNPPKSMTATDISTTMSPNQPDPAGLGLDEDEENTHKGIQQTGTLGNY